MSAPRKSSKLFGVCFRMKPTLQAIAKYPTALRAWFTPCLPGRRRLDALRLGTLGMRGSTVIKQDYGYEWYECTPPPLPRNPSKYFGVTWLHFFPAMLTVKLTPHLVEDERIRRRERKRPHQEISGQGQVVRPYVLHPCAQ